MVSSRKRYLAGVEASVWWGYRAENRKLPDVFWTMQFNLQSKNYGRLGWLRLSSKINHGDFLFDANLLVTDLRPAIVIALEHCIAASSQCAGQRSESVAWMPVGNSLFTSTREQRLAKPEELESNSDEAKHTAKAND